MKNLEDDPIAYAQKQHLKEANKLPFFKRIAYYFGYYKWPVIFTLAGILITVYAIFVIFFAPPTVLDGEFLNAPYEMKITEEEFISNFATYANIDLEKNHILFSSITQYNPDDSTTNTQLFVNLSAGQFDYFITSSSDLDILAGNEFLANVTYILPEELSSSLSDRFIYFDYTADDKKDNDELGVVPVGIDVTDSTILQNCGSWDNTDPIVFSFTCNSTRTETATTFLEWLLNSD